MCDLAEILLHDINYAKGIQNDYMDERVRMFFFSLEEEKEIKYVMIFKVFHFVCEANVV